MNERYTIIEPDCFGESWYIEVDGQQVCKTRNWNRTTELVRRANAYDGLVKALREISEALLEDATGKPPGTIRDAVIEQAKQALKDVGE